MALPHPHDLEREYPSRYVVDIDDFLEEVKFGITHIQENDLLRIEWHGGAWNVHHQSATGGSITGGGSWHPNNGLCEGGGICDWCGRTLFN